MNDDIHYMEMALDLAKKGAGFTSPNPMVGAVVVKGGKVVGKGWHEKVGGPHAEVNAINDAGDSAEGADIYVTLEPCNHTGRTPPCTEKILQAGIRRVVVAMEDPNPGVKGGGNDYLRSRGVQVESGVCEAEARKLNEFFIKHTLTKRPFVILKCASTLDGRIATRTGDSKWITCEKSRAHVHMIRHCVDGIMVGAGTVKADDPSLTTRLESAEGRDPVRVVLDTGLSVPENARIFWQQSNADTFLVCGDSVPEENRKRFEKKGVRVIACPEKNGMIDLDALMDILGESGITSLLVEGGSSVIASALREKIVDKACFFYAPKILGGDDGVPICSGEGPELMKSAVRLNNVSVTRFDDDVMIEGYI